MKRIILLAALMVLSGFVDTGVNAAEKKNLSPLMELLLNTQGDNVTPLTSETVISATGQVWLDRNLGASGVAHSVDDKDAYGDLYQWGRGEDGHEKRDSGTTPVQSSLDIPGHAHFITTVSSPYDWRIPRNDNLWQGGSGVNNPCPAGFRLPTETELDAERLSWGSDDATGAYSSHLKLSAAGFREYFTGTILNEGRFGEYWSSTVSGMISSYLSIGPTYAQIRTDSRAYGFTVRCIKD